MTAEGETGKKEKGTGRDRYGGTGKSDGEVKTTPERTGTKGKRTV